MDDRDEIARRLRDALRMRRGYADFFGWPAREVAEWGVVKEFGQSAVNEPGAPFRHLRARGQRCGRPDCEAVDTDGRRLGIEVTELVDASAIVQARTDGSCLEAEWDRAKFLAEVASRLSAKDQKTLKGGPYDEYIVLIHSDEPSLPIDVVEEWLAGHRFRKPEQIHRAYLLLSYDPRRNGCPYVRPPW
jgi:hypothetical protein